MKELWIHAGMPKNGSSAIQVFLARNIARLLEEGLDYVELSNINDAKRGQISSGNGALLARSMLPKTHESYYSAEPENIYSNLLSHMALTKTQKTLISSEFFAVVPLKRVEKLMDDLLNKNIVLKFIYYVRRQDRFLMSSYMQRVKRHSYTGLPEDYVQNNYKSSHFLKYHGYAKQYSEIIGRENLIPCVYELTNNHQQGLIGHFIEKILGFTPQWVQRESSINTSPSPLELKFMLACNQYSPRMKFSNYLVEDSIRRGDSLEYMSHQIVSTALIEEVMSYFEDQNKKFFDEFSEEESFPELTGSDYINISELSFSPTEMMNIVSGFLVRYDRRLERLESYLKANHKESEKAIGK